MYLFYKCILVAFLCTVHHWTQSILYVSFPLPGKFDPIGSFFLSFALLYFNILVPRICHQFAKSHPEIRHEIFKLPAVEHNLSEFIKALTITAVGYDVKIKSIWLKIYFDPIIGSFLLLSTPNLLHALRLYTIWRKSYEFNCRWIWDGDWACDVRGEQPPSPSLQPIPWPLPSNTLCWICGGVWLHASRVALLVYQWSQQILKS